MGAKHINKLSPGRVLVPGLGTMGGDPRRVSIGDNGVVREGALTQVLSIHMIASASFGLAPALRVGSAI